MKKKTRTLSLISYLETYEDVQSVIDYKANQIVSYAYALHDKDTYEKDVFDTLSGVLKHSKGELKKPHFHIYLLLSERRYVEEVQKWFMLKNKDGIIQNCLYEPLFSKSSLLDYLTHSTDKAKNKYQYDKSIVVSYNIDIDPVDNNEPIDETFDILQALMCGVPIFDLVSKYGRDFVYHYNQYKSLLENINFNFIEEINKNENY